MPTTKTPSTAAAKPQAVKKVIAAAKTAKVKKPAQKATVKAKSTATAPTQTTEKVKVKTTKIKPVRDSFTFPKDEYAVIDLLKKRAVKLGHPSKKSELLRAGIKALSAMPDAVFSAAVQSVPAIKTGRPGKS